MIFWGPHDFEIAMTRPRLPRALRALALGAVGMAPWCFAAEMPEMFRGWESLGDSMVVSWDLVGFNGI